LALLRAASCALNLSFHPTVNDAASDPEHDKLKIAARCLAAVSSVACAQDFPFRSYGWVEKWARLERRALEIAVETAVT